MNPLRPKVLFVIATLGAGGAERVISEIANDLAAKGRHVVGVLTLSTATPDHYPLASSIERITANLIWNSRFPWDVLTGNIRRSQIIKQAVEIFGADVVVSFIEQTNVRVLLALLGSKVPVIASERIDPRKYHVGFYWDLLRRVMYPCVHRLVVQTDSVANGWANKIVHSEKIAIIPNFVSASYVPPSPLARKGNVILAVGRMYKQKGFDILLQAFSISGLAREGAQLVILGDGPERANLEKLAEQLNISSALFMPGVVKDPQTWMARCTLFVLPSRYEGFPNVLLEAMAQGCSVIASDCDSGPADIVTHEENGMLVAPESAEALAFAMRDLMFDSVKRERLGTKAVTVLDRFSKESVMTDWENLINSVCADSIQTSLPSSRA